MLREINLTKLKTFKFVFIIFHLFIISQHKKFELKVYGEQFKMLSISLSYR